VESNCSTSLQNTGGKLRWNQIVTRTPQNTGGKLRWNQIVTRTPQNTGGKLKWNQIVTRTLQNTRGKLRWNQIVTRTPQNTGGKLRLNQIGNVQKVCSLTKYTTYFQLQRTWWRLFQKRVVRTKFDIYVFITARTSNIRFFTAQIHN
jgi:hypothetical protein